MRLFLSLWLVCHLFIFTNQLFTADNHSSAGARNEFINNFHRTGLNTTPEDAKLLQILVSSSKSIRGIEIGSATGYGAIHMGIAFEQNGGELVTIDIDPNMVRKCRENINKVGLDKTVKVIEGDALKVLKQLSGNFDFLFIDARKSDYLNYFLEIEKKLLPGAIIVADNVIQYAFAMSDFLDYIDKSDQYEMVVVRASDEKRDGMAIIQKKK